MPESELKSMVANLINSSVNNMEQITNEYLEILKSFTNASQDNSNEIASLEKKIELLKQKREKILEYNLNGGISDAEFVSRNNEYLKETKEIEKRLYELENSKEPESLEYQFEKIRIKLEKYKDVAPDDINRTIVDELFDKIVIEPSDKTKATLAFHLRNGDIEKRGFPICRSENIAFTI